MSVALKQNTDGLPSNKKFDSDSLKERLVVEAYVPPDPGPYPQDQPKQNSVGFTPTQVIQGHCCSSEAYNPL